MPKLVFMKNFLKAVLAWAGVTATYDGEVVIGTTTAERATGPKLTEEQIRLANELRLKRAYTEKFWSGWLVHFLWTGSWGVAAFWKDCSLSKAIGIFDAANVIHCSVCSVSKVIGISDAAANIIFALFGPYMVSTTVLAGVAFYFITNRVVVKFSDRLRLLIIVTLATISIRTEGIFVDCPSLSISIMWALCCLPFCRLLSLEENFGLFECLLKPGIDATRLLVVKDDNGWFLLWLVTVFFIFLKFEVDKKLGKAAHIKIEPAVAASTNPLP